MARRPRLVHDCDQPLAAPGLIADIAVPAHPADRRLRRRGTIAMVALGLVVGCLLFQQRLLPRADDLTELRTAGPFRATAAGTIQPAAAVQVLHPGELFGWNSRFCVGGQVAALMIQVRLVRLEDNRVLLYRERPLAPDAAGCASAAWTLPVPADAPPGRYHVQRFLLITSPGGGPRSRILPSLAIDIAP